MELQKKNIYIRVTKNQQRESCLIKIFTVFLLSLFQIFFCYADIASTAYVQAELTTKVDASKGTTQTMAGDYVITGTIKVPTQPLPSI